MDHLAAQHVASKGSLHAELDVFGPQIKVPRSSIVLT